MVYKFKSEKDTQVGQDRCYSWLAFQMGLQQLEIFSQCPELLHGAMPSLGSVIL